MAVKAGSEPISVSTRGTGNAVHPRVGWPAPYEVDYGRRRSDAHWLGQLDRRSFDLNYENNILFYDAALTADMRARQDEYISSSIEVKLEDLDSWSLGRRIWNNALGMIGPLL